MDLDIDVLNIELTTVCNVHCFACARTVHPTKIEPNNIDINLLINFLDKESLKNIKTFQVCGNSGDPIFHPKLKKFLKHVVLNRCQEKSILEIQTNGSIHNETWWKDLAKILEKKDKVIFAIDGLEDTHKRHRQTDFKTVLRNMSAFINAGGSAIWQYVMFDYNEHQVEEAYELAKNIGVTKFTVMPTNYCDSEHGFPSEEAIKKYATQFKPKYNQKDDKFKNIGWRNRCYLASGRLYINSYGYVSPCNFICGYEKFPSHRHFWPDLNLYFDFLKYSSDLHISKNTFMSVKNHEFFHKIIKNVKNHVICNRMCDSKTFMDYDL